MTRAPIIDPRLGGEFDPLRAFGLREVAHRPETTSGTIVYHTSDRRTGKRERRTENFARSRETPPRTTLAKLSPSKGDCALTFLRVTEHECAAKTIVVDPASVTPDPSTWKYEVQDYNCGALYCGLIEVEISDVHELAYWLYTAAQDSRTLLIRGKPLPNAMPPLLRRGEDADEHPTFRDVPRRWVMIDLDKALTGKFDLIQEPEVAVRCALALLPDFLRRATCAWQLSGTAWLRGARLHLFFWFDRHVTNTELRIALKNCPIDHSVFRCVQPHFIADPIYVGATDPLPRRWGLLAGDAP